MKTRAAWILANIENSSIFFFHSGRLCMERCWSAPRYRPTVWSFRQLFLLRPTLRMNECTPEHFFYWFESQFEPTCLSTSVAFASQLKRSFLTIDRLYLYILCCVNHVEASGCEIGMQRSPLKQSIDSNLLHANFYWLFLSFFIFNGDSFLTTSNTKYVGQMIVFFFFPCMFLFSSLK